MSSSLVPLILAGASDSVLLGGTRGAIVYRGASLWQGLSPGTVGLPLISGGLGADPTYALLDPTRIGSGTAGISITGNAATATNGVVTTGSYSNPSWITALSASKLTSGILPQARLPDTAVTPGSYTLASITVDAAGRLTAASNGSAPGIAIDSSIAGGTAGRILYEGIGPVLADSADLTFDGTRLTLPVDGLTVGSVIVVKNGGYVGLGGVVNPSNLTGNGAGVQVLGNLNVGNKVMIQVGGIDYGFLGQSGAWFGSADANFIFASYRPSFYLATDNSATPALGVHPGQRVGINIGTATPAGQLEVAAGDVNLTGILVRGMLNQVAPLIVLQQLSSTEAKRNTGYIDGIFANDTDASWKGRLIFYAGDYTSSNLGKREGLRIESDGTQAISRFTGTVSCLGTGSDSEQFGALTSASGNSSVAIGRAASSGGISSTAIGFSALAGGSTSVAIGQSASSSGTSSFAIGSQANASGDNSIAIGQLATSTGSGAITVGSASSSSSLFSLAIGYSTSAIHAYSMVFGAFGVTTANNQIIFSTAITQQFNAEISLELAGTSSTAQQRSLANIDTQWVDSIDSSRKGRLIFRVNDYAAKREGLRIESDGTQPLLGLFGATAVAKSTGWSVSNVTTDKSFDANSTTIDEVADVLGTLINYLISRGDLGA
jgi:hypothetical protein